MNRPPLLHPPVCAQEPSLSTAAGLVARRARVGLLPLLLLHLLRPHARCRRADLHARPAHRRVRTHASERGGAAARRDLLAQRGEPQGVGRAAEDVHRGPAGRQRRERRALHREVHWVDGWRRTPDAALRRHLWLPRRLKECKRQASPAVRGGADGIPGRAGGRPRPDREDTS